MIARGRLRQLRRAVDCFGFHLASLDIRQNSAVHERTVAELIDAAMPGMSYLALGEEARIALLAGELRNARPLTSTFVKYSEETLGELAVFHAAAEAHAKFGADAIPQCIISMCKGISDMLEVAVLLKEVGLVDPSGRSAINIVPLFETIEDLQASSRHHGPDAVAARLPQAGGQPRRGAGSDARLFRQQQGWRLRHLGLGALQGRDRPGRGVRAAPRAPAAVPRPRRLGRPRRRPEL